MRRALAAATLLLWAGRAAAVAVTGTLDIAANGPPPVANSSDPALQSPTTTVTWSAQCIGGGDNIMFNGNIDVVHSADGSTAGNGYGVVSAGGSFYSTTGLGEKIRARVVGMWCAGSNGASTSSPDVESNDLIIPPLVDTYEVPTLLPTGKPLGASAPTLRVFATPVANETVTIEVEGGGITYLRLFSANEWLNTNEWPLDLQTMALTPTIAGPITVTATLGPYNASSTATVETYLVSGPCEQCQIDADCDVGLACDHGVCLSAGDCSLTAGICGQYACAPSEQCDCNSGPGAMPGSMSPPPSKPKARGCTVAVGDGVPTAAGLLVLLLLLLLRRPASRLFAADRH